jgi:hypothetical protein
MRSGVAEAAVLDEPARGLQTLGVIPRPPTWSGPGNSTGGWLRCAPAGLRDSTFAFVPSRARESVAEHEHILELTAEGADGSAIELAARDHHWATMDAFLRSRTGS